LKAQNRRNARYNRFFAKARRDLKIRKRTMFAAVVAAAAASPLTAQAQAARQPEATPSAQTSKSKRAKPAETAAKAPAPLPCPRAKWKDDPVCFGSNDPAALPLPSSGSGGGKTASHAEDASISPKASVNMEPQQPVFGNNPNPHPSGNDFGGGLGVNFHF
jgi:hypothetical protein